MKIEVFKVGGDNDGAILYETNDEWDAILWARKYEEQHGNCVGIINTETGKLSENW